MPACLSAALFAGCAGAGSSVTQPARTADAPVPGAAVRRPKDASTCSGPGTASFLGGGANNNAYGIDSGVVTGGNNEACDDYSVVVGGYSNAVASSANTAKESVILDGDDNTINMTGAYAFIGSGQSNDVSAERGIVAGGYHNGNSGINSIIGAGLYNLVESGADNGVVGGGFTNKLIANTPYAAIVGGEYNTVSGEGGYIAAGGYNTLSGEGAVIDGGFNNNAAGSFATIPGGYVNSAAGTYSFAAGARASAAQTGTFVWSDGSDGDAILTSARAYQFLARASGGVTFWTNAASTVGATLAPGSGTWASASDRNLKTDVAGIDDAAVLDKVAALPISRWSYRSERGVRHVGPMAQDFYAAFGVGEDDKHITSIDEDGVALAAIKALRAENVTLRGANATLQAQVAALRRHDDRVDAELHRLSAALESSRSR
ncbi:MAG TPA: tail fiber domain-containing protein [Candidatus Elarobacter sp.]|nr:tail fiber domain-containing protein [Candidatus Elarobacter sp.]